MFDLANPIRVRENLIVDESVVRELVGPLLTPERLAKIDRVVRSRMFNPVVVLESLYDRGNVSAVMRSCEGLGFGRLHLIETQDKFKESQRTTAGSDKWLEIKKWQSTADCVKQLKSQGKKIIVTHLSATAKNLPDLDLTGNIALVLGNEKEGVSSEMVQASDECAVFPMTGFVQSFNISVAAAVCLSEIASQRKRKLGQYGDLSEQDQNTLRAYYYLRTQDSAADVLQHHFSQSKLS